MVDNPIISINKLAEFVNATESRKRSILKSFKDPEMADFSKRVLYSSAKNTILAFMVDENHEYQIFDRKKELLRKEKPASDRRRNDITNSILAMDKFLNISKKDLEFYLKHRSKRGLPSDKKQLQTNGVIVSLTPDISFWNKENKLIGVMKFVFSKGRSLTRMEGEIISGMLHKSMRRAFKVDLETKNCVVLDVFKQRFFIAPVSYSYHSRLLRKALSEYNRMWVKI